MDSEDIHQFITEYGVIIILAALLILVLYLNMKINDLQYRFDQSFNMQYQPNRYQMDRSYQSYPYYQSTNYPCGR